MCKNDLSWYVVYTYPHQEKRIFTDLIGRNFNAFLPIQKTIRQWSDRRKEIEVPLFPNYVFVQTSQKECFKVLNVPGITRVISFDGKPAVVSDEEINTIRELISQGVSIEKEEYYVKGDKVKVVRGPLAGMVGVLLDRKGRKRFGIRFYSFVQTISVDIQSDFFERIIAV